VISSCDCGVVLLVVLCSVWFFVLSQYSFSSYWKIDISQLQVQSMIWASTLQIRKHEYFGDLNFIILFVGILPMYAINLCALSLFPNSSLFYVFSDVCIWCDVLYQFEWMNIVLFLSKKEFINVLFSSIDFTIQNDLTMFFTLLFSVLHCLSISILSRDLVFNKCYLFKKNNQCY
jgi:hypothetical protein